MLRSSHPKPGAILCQTIDRHLTLTWSRVRHCAGLSMRSVTVASLVLCSVGIGRHLENRTTVPHLHKGLCYFVSVFPSFTYLTAPKFSFAVFPFTFFTSAHLTPVRRFGSSSSDAVVVRLTNDRVSALTFWLRRGCFQYDRRRAWTNDFSHVLFSLNTCNGHNGWIRSQLVWAQTFNLRILVEGCAVPILEEFPGWGLGAGRSGLWI